LFSPRSVSHTYGILWLYGLLNILKGAPRLLKPPLQEGTARQAIFERRYTHSRLYTIIPFNRAPESGGGFVLLPETAHAYKSLQDRSGIILRESGLANLNTQHLEHEVRGAINLRQIPGTLIYAFGHPVFGLLPVAHPTSLQYFQFPAWRICLVGMPKTNSCSHQRQRFKQPTPQQLLDIRYKEISSGSEDEKTIKDSLATVRSQLRLSKEELKQHKKRLEIVNQEISALRTLHTDQEAKLEESSREVASIRDEHNTKMAEIAEVFDALSAGHEQEMQSTAQEILRLQSLLAKSSRTNEQLQALVDCDVCTQNIMRPFTLESCGHTFCYGCLRAWFLVNREKFEMEHPMYDPTRRFEKLSVADTFQIAQNLAN
ncbi:hypothetical protein CPB83DRAFT_899979, partial [Crepidotus variabilis]